MFDDKKQKSILLTGGTGNFGQFLVTEFLKHPDINLYLLVRANSSEEAVERVSEFIKIDPARVIIHKSDLTKENLGLTPQVYEELTRKITHVIHSAASTRFNLSLDEARLNNVVTTKNILEFAKNCQHLVRFGFLSSTYIAGRRSGLIKEDEFEHNEGFSNTYQQSKYEAEALVRDEKLKFPIVIFRPPFIVSPDFTGSIRGKKNFLSILISFIAKGYLPIVPGSGESTLDIVNSYDAAKVIVDLFLKDHLSHIAYHISNGAQALNIGILHKIIEEKIGKKIPIEYCGDLDSFKKRLDEISVQKHHIKEIYQKAESFLLEPAFPKIFDNKNTLSELGSARLGENPLETLKIMFKDSWNLSE